MDWWDVHGMEWNAMEPIPFYTTQSFNFSFPPIWEVSNGMKFVSWNFTILPSFYLPLPLLNHNFQHVLFSISTDCISLSSSLYCWLLFFFSCLLISTILLHKVPHFYPIYFFTVCFYACLVMCIKFYLSRDLFIFIMCIITSILCEPFILWTSVKIFIYFRWSW